MSDYKAEECVEINKQMYNWANIMDSLYWSNIHKYSSVLKKIYSTSSAVSKWDSFAAGKKKEITELAELYIKWIFSSSK